MNLRIEDKSDGNTLQLFLDGKIDGLGAGQLEKHMKQSFTAMAEAFHPVKLLILDMENVKYISSAGLRVLIITSKHMAKEGEFRLRNVPPEVMAVLSTCGLDKQLNIHKKA